MKKMLFLERNPDFCALVGRFLILVVSEGFIISKRVLKAMELET